MITISGRGANPKVSTALCNYLSDGWKIIDKSILGDKGVIYIIQKKETKKKKL